jgi:hypothetical protein
MNRSKVLHALPLGAEAMNIFYIIGVIVIIGNPGLFRFALKSL